MQYKIDKPIRMLELFSGYMSQSLALKYLGVNFESYKTSEWEKNAIAAAHAIHFPNDTTDYSEGMTKDELVSYLVEFGISNDGKSPMEEKSVARKGEKWLRETYNDIQATHNIGSVLNIHAEDLEITDKDKYEYMLTYSFPCFTEDTLVLTKDGYKRIKDVVVNDYVLTHDNTYQRVLDSKKTGEKNIYKINAMGIDEIECTDNHKFYVREMYRKYPYLENGKRAAVRLFKDPEWIECKDLTKKHYLGVAINQKSILPKWDGVDFEWSDGRKTRHKNEISKLLNNHSFWWIIGRYLGDGWIRTQGGIIICCAKNETLEILVHLRNCGFNYTISEERTTNKIHIPLIELEKFCEQFDRGAMNKKLPGFIFDMPKELLRSLIDGYISADGCYTQNKYSLTSISRELIYGFAQIIAKAYNRPFSIYKVDRKPTCVIEGRTVNQHDSYQLTWKIDNRKQDKAFYEDGYVWFPIKEVVNTNITKDVYDITVENNHSFTANGVIVHNCQDLSLAGKQRGMDKGSDTRSALLWEVERILTECNEKNCLPQILLMENVSQVHGKKNLDNFNTWLSFLESLGYSNYWEDLNAKDFTVPQNRQRTFAISILGDYEYEFPKPVELKKRLKDVLEDKVDESYYINTEKAETLIGSLIDKGILPSQTNTYSLKNMGSSDENRIPDGERSDVAHTLMARDWKGLNNYGSNGVIEKEQIGIDLTTNNPQSREVSNCLKAGCRGITNFAQDETGVAEGVS